MAQVVVSGNAYSSVVSEYERALEKTKENAPLLFNFEKLFNTGGSTMQKVEIDPLEGGSTQGAGIGGTFHFRAPNWGKLAGVALKFSSLNNPLQLERLSINSTANITKNIATIPNLNDHLAINFISQVSLDTMRGTTLQTMYKPDIFLSHITGTTQWLMKNSTMARGVGVYNMIGGAAAIADYPPACNVVPAYATDQVVVLSAFTGGGDGYYPNPAYPFKVLAPAGQPTLPAADGTYYNTAFTVSRTESLGGSLLNANISGKGSLPAIWEVQLPFSCFQNPMTMPDLASTEQMQITCQLSGTTTIGYGEYNHYTPQASGSLMNTVTTLAAGTDKSIDAAYLAPAVLGTVAGAKCNYISPVLITGGSVQVKCLFYIIVTSQSDRLQRQSIEFREGVSTIPLTNWFTEGSQFMTPVSNGYGIGSSWNVVFNLRCKNSVKYTYVFVQSGRGVIADSIADTCVCSVRVKAGGTLLWQSNALESMAYSESGDALAGVTGIQQFGVTLPVLTGTGLADYDIICIPWGLIRDQWEKEQTVAMEGVAHLASIPSPVIEVSAPGYAGYSGGVGGTPPSLAKTADPTTAQIVAGNPIIYGPFLSAPATTVATTPTPQAPRCFVEHVYHCASQYVTNSSGIGFAWSITDID